MLKEYWLNGKLYFIRWKTLIQVNTKKLFKKSDSAMKQFLLYLDDINELGGRFVVEDLDETHLFIDSNYVDRLKEKIDDLMEKHSYVPENKAN